MFGPPPGDAFRHIERMRRLDNERDEAAYRRDSEHKARVVEAHAYGRRKAELEAERATSRPDRAAAVRDVEALLRRVHDVTEEADDVVRFYLAGDGAFLRDVHNMTAAELASLVVDAVLGVEQDGPDR